MERVKVWGDLACFTRPEFGTERVSYEVMTPSAARGILEAIFWKPEISWDVREIQVLKPIRRYSILRNEINDRQSHRRKEPYYADSTEPKSKGGDGENRTQRHTLMLRDVEYIIGTELVRKPHCSAHIAKYLEQFRRRVRRGACFTQPYLGTRECTAYFGPVEGGEEPVDITDDLGRMLREVWPERSFFSARLERGVLRVPAAA